MRSPYLLEEALPCALIVSTCALKPLVDSDKPGTRAVGRALRSPIAKELEVEELAAGCI